MIGSGLKQILRRPVSVALFLLLTVTAATFLSLGLYLFMSTQSTLEQIEGSYRTIGTIAQKPIGTTRERGFNDWTQRVIYSSILEYGDPISLDDFNFESVKYIYPPENRAHYFAVSDKYKKGYWAADTQSYINTIEFKIMEIYPDVDPVRAEVTRVLGGSYKVGQEVWICQHMIDNPTPLKLGKIYVAGVSWDATVQFEDYHKIAKYTALDPVRPANHIVSQQIDKSGKRLDDPEFANLTNSIFEVTEGFYESAIGKRLILSENSGKLLGNANITATNSLGLMMSFVKREVIIEDGREISQEEFDEGVAVCLIGADQAVNNQLSVGDKIDFSFYNVRYGSSMGQNSRDVHAWSFDLFNANGEEYSSFYASEYEIVGIYKTYKDGNRDDYNLGYSTVIVPSKSIKASGENNRSGNLVLQPYNVSFEIPNGTTGEYLSQVKSAGLDEHVDITFYDGGYENIKSGLSDLSQISIVLMTVGISTTLAVLLFFSFLLIVKQKKRIAIERSLGIPKLRCGLSLVLGVMLIVSIGAGIGCTAGFISGGIVTETVETFSEQNERSTQFSNWVNEGETTIEHENMNTFEAQVSLWVLLYLAVIATSLIITVLSAKANLDKEPLELLSEKE